MEIDLFETDNKNSWSLTRYKLFEFCERAYFYQYFGTEDDLNENTNQGKSELYKLKKIISLENWASNTFNDSLQSVFLDTHKTDKNVFKLKFSKELYRNFIKNKFQILQNEILIKEIYNGYRQKEEALQYAENLLHNKLTSLIRSELPEILSKIPVQAKINTLNPSFFIFNNIKILNAPLIAWKADNKLNSLNLYFNRSFASFNLLDWDIISSVNNLFWQSRFHIPNESIETVSYFLNTEDFSSFRIFAKRNLKETLNIIENSCRKIFSRQTYDKKIYIENFEKTENINNCSICSYKECCSKNF